jgi:hypothetical protein
MSRFVILSEAKNLTSIQVQEKKQGEILRFAQNDSALSFSVACSDSGGLVAARSILTQPTPTGQKPVPQNL